MMARKNNSLTLVIVLVILVGVFLLLRVRSRKAESTLQADFIRIDTAQITEILLYPQAAQGAELKFFRSGNEWRVSKDKREAPVEAGSMKNMFRELLSIKPKRLVAVSDTAWDNYRVSDSTATRIVVHEGRKTTLDLYIGRFNVNQQSPQMYGGYQNRVMGSSYIRPGGQKKTYETEGFLALSFNQDFDAWRDHLFVRLPKDDLRKLSFTYPADTGFVLEYRDSVWMVDGMPADSAATADYLSTWSFRRYSDFRDDFSEPANADFEITVERRNMDPVVIRGYTDPEGGFVFHSDMNPETWFADRDSSIFKTFLVPKNKFTKPLTE